MPTALYLASLDSNPLRNSGRRNLLINPYMDINQRGFSGDWATKNVGEYGFDRWKKHASGIEQIIPAFGYGVGMHRLSWTGAGAASVDGIPVINGVPFATSSNSAPLSVVVPEMSTQIQLVAGSKAAPLSPVYPPQELIMCQYYAEVVSFKSGDRVCAAAWFKAGKLRGALAYQPKRVIPTVSSAQTNELGGYTADGIIGGIFTFGIASLSAVRVQGAMSGDASVISGLIYAGSLIVAVGNISILIDSDY